MGTVLSIREVRAMCAKVSKEEILRQLGPHVLVGRPSLHKTFDDRTEPARSWVYVTNVNAPQFRSTDRSLDFADDSPVFPLQSKRGVPASKFLVGCASSNDVCIDHASVSKLHARIQMSADGTLTVTDAGSRNGTTVNGATVSDKPVRMTPRSELAFGDERVVLMQTAALYDQLSRYGDPRPG